MPPTTTTMAKAIDMRHSKLTAEDAAILTGELNKPSWESRNEGIHERVSFEDTIWGFDLAGGSYYQTPLRVTYVKKNSRAEKAGIRPGDRLKRINDIETSTLTIQEAHEIIVESGVHLKIAVTAPEDEEDAYYCYEDQIDENGYDSDEERRLAEERARKRQVHARVNHYWSLQWPWVSKRRIIYRESNCFMVPSKYEEKNKSKFPTQPMLKTQEDIVLDSLKSERELQDAKAANTIPTPVVNGEKAEDPVNQPIVNGIDDKKDTKTVNGPITANPDLNRNLSQIAEIEEPIHEEEMNSTLEELAEDTSQIEEMDSKSQNDISIDESNVESEAVDVSENVNSQDVSMDDKNEESIEMEHQNDDDVINELLEESLPKAEEESIIDSILSDSEDQMNHADER